MISIVAAYYNRIPQLTYTLRCMHQTSVKDFEMIIVDDFSGDYEKLCDLQKDYPFLKIVKMADKVSEKNYANPCVPFNVGFKEAKGDIIVIQNPECCHVGDVLGTCVQHINDSNYLTFACYSLNNPETEELHKSSKYTVQNRSVTSDGDSGWYNHPTYRPVGYHFTSCITKKNLDKLGGFDQKYANGHGWDDNEILVRIQRLGLTVSFVENPYVVHQFHYGGKIDTSKIKQDNRALFNEYTLKSNIIEANK